MISAMIEGNLGLQWGMREFQFGSDCETLVKNLSVLQGGDVQTALNSYLATEKRSIVTIRPQ